MSTICAVAKLIGLTSADIVLSKTHMIFPLLLDLLRGDVNLVVVNE